MLTELHIRNLAVVDEVTVSLAPGFSALTGETGAGKSILVDALALALGDRADSQAIRAGAQRTEVTATFDLADRPDLVAWLENNDLDDGRECIVRRTLSREGRSRGSINGRTVAMQSLRELGQQLIDICGQQAHQSLRHRSVQTAVLDQHGNHGNLIAEVEKRFQHWQQMENEYRELAGLRDDRTSRQELLAYQVRELEALNLDDGEADALETERLLLANRGTIAAGLGSALARIYDEENTSAQDAISGARRTLEPLVAFDPRLGAVVDLLGEAEIHISEAAEQLRHHLHHSEHDPERQQQVESRLQNIHEVARKHHVTANELPALRARLCAELDRLTGNDLRLDELSAATGTALQQLRTAAQALTKARRRAAGALAEDVTGYLQQLGMPGAGFHIRIEAPDEHRPGPGGADRVDFMVSTNPGQPAGLLTRIASGGELSRISLAIQVVAAATAQVPTLIFDEVDAGVGGAIAEVVGVCLARLSAHRQVLCVTHLPQVACQAHQQLRVSKMSGEQVTRTMVTPLNASERVEEIARMLGGVSITERARQHAGEMLEAAATRRTG